MAAPGLELKRMPNVILNKESAIAQFGVFTKASAVTVPPYIDHRWDMLPSSDQGSSPKCAAYAMAGIVEYYRWRVTGIAEQVDPNPIYSAAKTLDGVPDQEGTTLEAVAQAAINLGLIPIDPKSIRVVKSPLDVKRAIHRYGPILSAYEINRGWLQVPLNGWIADSAVDVGPHAVVTCGYADDETPQYTEIQNSWGEDGVGWRGFMRMRQDQFIATFNYGLAWDLF